ncbi:Ig-like domain repeat protein [Cohnella faecalis]|uniref:DUF5011 domain-containing protein n=1 Tax=Cohnella faecalis TaxID=2315694 RepID=A0A398CJR5_9BACL|nr:Ig-like domain repeat protein [Cohnella faecalis]RIE02943.1 hypothetical protein D3H35_20265 [Cohnella faecalis]
MGQAGEEPAEIDWLDIPASGEIATFNHVQEDGVFQLYAKAIDKAGNVTVARMDNAVTVNSAVNVSAAFHPGTDGSYMKSPVVYFGIQGIGVESVKYAVTGSSAAPAQYSSVAEAVYEAVLGLENGEVYVIPANTALNGTYVVHVKVKEAAANRYYTYSKLYSADNAAPKVTFSPGGVSYPLERHNVKAAVSDSLSGVALKQYQWLKSGEPAPVKESAGWAELPEDGAVSIDNNGLSPGEIADYVLYVVGEDAAGNSVVASTGIFKVTRKAEAEAPAAADSELLYVYGDSGDGYTAVVRLNLENAIKEGYRYSLSSDGGSTWSRWLPYSSFAEVGGLTDDNPATIGIKAKFRSPDGKESEPVGLRTDSASTDEPVYGIPSHNTLRPVKSDDFVLSIKVPTGVRAVPSVGLNPAEPARIRGNQFRVTKNGVYSFDLTDLSDDTRSAVLLVVVDNMDDIAPEGTVEYSMLSPTNSNVQARLVTSSEPVRVLNNSGRSVYTFAENGTFTFRFEDEAGNTASVVAEVDNIDRTPPAARIVRSYAYGENGSRTFATLRDGDDNVVLAQGVVLHVEKANPLDEDFKIVSGTNGGIVRTNGEVHFTVVDAAGNTAVLTEDIADLAPFLSDPDSVTYEFVDENGVPLPEDRIAVIDGVKVAKGKVKVTVSGTVLAPNRAFLGTAPASNGNGGYSNLISDENGSYSYSRTYSANGQTYLAISDLLGNVNKVPIVVRGLDNTAPVIKLNRPIASVTRNKADFNALTDLGGYVVSDNASKPANLVVEASSLNLSQVGTQTVVYTVRDEAGNTSTIQQKVYVLPEDGMMIVGNGLLLSAAQSEKVLFDTNIVTFDISRYNLMDVGGTTMENEWGTYDIYYQSGLYREGQMKYIAQGISMSELLNRTFTVQFPATGWYTVIVRTQEREREFTTFFIANMGQ